MANKRRDGSKERLWRGRVSRWERSGLTIRAFCRREQLSEPSFYGWRRELKRRDDPRAKSPDEQAKLPSKHAKSPDEHAKSRSEQVPAAPAFVPARIPLEAMLANRESANSADFVLELAGGRRLRLPGSLPLAQLATLVQAIEANASPQPTEFVS